MVKNSISLLKKNIELTMNEGARNTEEYIDLKNRSISEMKICDLASGCGFFYHELIREISKIEENNVSFSIKEFIENNIFAIEKDQETHEQLKIFSKQY